VRVGGPGGEGVRVGVEVRVGVSVMVGVKVGRGVRVSVGVSVMVGESVGVAVCGKVRVRVGVEVGAGANIAGYATIRTTRVKMKMNMIPKLVSRKRILAVSGWVSGIAERLDFRRGFVGHLCAHG
jgi:UDP-3-O-[3-hydroxymyristoyl] glucosamine N-acyltransferase